MENLDNLDNRLIRTRVKMCGMTSDKDVKYAVDAGVDSVGFIFYEKSTRFISIKTAKPIIASLPPFITSVALFVNPTVKLVQTVIEQTKINLLQFHGSESQEFCQQFSYPYIKAIPMCSNTDLEEMIVKYGTAQGLLLDACKKGVYGGTGTTFDWELLLKYKLQNLTKPIILAGGLGVHNIAEAVDKLQPWAVDVCSGIELSFGKKSKDKIQQFMRNIKIKS